MEKTKGFIAEFKEFISRGSVVDLAVGIIVGSAFTSIVNSLVNDIVMPVVGAIIGGIDFTTLRFVLKAATDTSEEVAIMYGNFIQEIRDNTVVIAIGPAGTGKTYLAVAMAVDAFRRKEEVPEEKPEEKPEEPSEEILLLREIRDSLRK